MQRRSEADGEDGADVHHPKADGLWKNKGRTFSRHCFVSQNELDSDKCVHPRLVLAAVSSGVGVAVVEEARRTGRLQRRAQLVEGVHQQELLPVPLQRRADRHQKEVVSGGLLQTQSLFKPALAILLGYTWKLSHSVVKGFSSGRGNTNHKVYIKILNLHLFRLDYECRSDKN